MNSEFSPELQAELMDDFHAEADEYFTQIRTELTSLEEALTHGRVNAAALESMFRSMHSLKGISAIVGLREVEQLAHSAEDFLRQLTREQCTLTDFGLQVLIDAAHRLEQLVSGHRLKKPLPDISGIISQLGKFSAASPTDAAKAQANPELQQSSQAESTAVDFGSLQARGLITWRCTFSPSKELDSRGINVSSVRARLSQNGEILSATPRIASGGSMTFEFVTAFRETPSDLGAWEADGISLAPIETISAEAVTTGNKPALEDDQSAGFFIAPSHYVRVDLSRLDELMRLAGELVIHRSRLDERLLRTVGAAGKDRSGLQEVNHAFARTLRELREAISAVRMVSVAEIFTRMPFVVRDLARETGKKARLVLQGQQTEIDKYIVERLKEPLLHLVRNALSHGVESTEARVAAGKNPEATIVLDASTVGDWVAIRVRDDGRGVDPAAIAKRAKRQGLPIPALLDHAAVLNLLCEPGFSTREEADRAAGRGVGMAVVQTTVRQLGGSLSLDTQLGAWTEFTLRLPLTLSIMPALIVGLGDQTCAVAQSAVEQIVQISAAEVRMIQRTEIVPYREGLLPLVRLRKLFGLPALTVERLNVVVIASERGSVGLVIDTVSAMKEVVVRSMNDPLLQVPGISGATELGDGRPVLILDTVALTNGVVRPPAGSLPIAEPPLKRVPVEV